jgi:molecular chaperone HtpG
MLTVSEEARRMEDMMRMYSLDASSFPTEYTLLINTSSSLIKRIDALCVEDREKALQMASYIYKLSLLTQKKFNADEMQKFMQESFELLMKL